MEKSLRALRQSCESRLRELELPDPFDIVTFCNDVAARRGRQIILRPVASKAGPFGMLAATAKVDFIFYEAETSPVHQEHIILHEIAHLLCGHQAISIEETEYLKLLLPDLTPEVFRHVLQRAAYSAEEDREAEMLASLILLRVTAIRPSRTNETSSSGSLLTRLTATLEDELGERK